MSAGSVYSTVPARVHRLHGPRHDGQPVDARRSPYLVAIDSIPRAEDVARGLDCGNLHLGRAADDGFGNLLAVGQWS